MTKFLFALHRGRAHSFLPVSDVTGLACLESGTASSSDGLRLRIKSFSRKQERRRDAPS
jgi:hypothetical protein